MKSFTNRKYLQVPATCIIFILALLLQAQGSNPEAMLLAQTAAAGYKMKVEGVIVKRDADSFILRDDRGSDLSVVLSDSTEVKEKKKNIFRRARNYATTQLLVGLNVEVNGRQDSEGQLVADEVKIKDDDLRYVSSMQTRVTPIESRLTEMETQLAESEQNAQRLSGQVEEVSEIAKAARSAAKAAQDEGDAAKLEARAGIEEAKSTARTANERISALDDYEVSSARTVLFAFGSATLNEEAKSQLDALAAEAKNQKGYMIEVTGYASSDGDEATNLRLSQRRADSVIRYLTENHSIPLRRLITPFGFGEKQPISDNSTLEGRKQNRRAEIKILVNKGVRAQASN